MRIFAFMAGKYMHETHHMHSRTRIMQTFFPLRQALSFAVKTTEIKPE